MKNLYKTLLAVTAFGFTSIASAAVFDFGAIANGNEYGAESISFTDNGVTVTATGWAGLNPTGTTPDYFAYLDSGNAGLGVCQNLNGDQCAPTSDDNVTYTETLRLVFDHEVTIDGIIFVNGDHNTDFAGNFILTVDGISDTYALTNDFALPDLFGTVFEFYNPNSGGDSNVSNNQQFYINELTTGTRGLDEPPAVPIPAAVWLFGSGLLGLVAVARRKA